MRLSEYIERLGYGTQARIARASGVSKITINKAAHGHPIGQYKVARAISDATGGAVSVEELCNPAPIEE